MLPSNSTDALAVQLIEMLRSVDKKVTEVNDRLIRIEALEFDEKIAKLEEKREKDKEEINKLHVSLERLQTKVAPLLVIVTAGMSYAASAFAAGLFN